MPKIAPLIELDPIFGCAPGGTNFLRSDFTSDFDISAHLADIVGGAINFQAVFGPIGTVAYVCPPITNQTSGTTPIQVRVAPAPSCSVSPAGPVCPGDSACFTVTPTGAGPFSYSWTGPGGFSATNTATICITNAQAANAGNYVVTVYDAFGCTSVCSNNLVVNPTPTCNITGPTLLLCPAWTATFTNTVSPAGGTVTHNWSISGPGIINGSATGPTVSVTATNMGVITLTDDITRDECPGSCQFQFTATCQPTICVDKEVVCDLPTGCADDWSKLAEGVKTLNTNAQEICPAFCYRITVWNCGQEGLTNVTLVDNVLGSLANYAALAIGQTNVVYVAGKVHCTGVTNTVTATGTGEFSGITTNATSTAAVTVKQIAISCDATVNGVHNLEVPCDTEPRLVTNSVSICNVGDLPVIARIDAASVFALAGCEQWQNVALPLDPGQCTNIDLCVDAVICPQTCGLAWTHYVHVIAEVDASKTDVCAYTVNRSNEVVTITATTDCDATVICRPPNACRVTGGGRQDDPLVFPSGPRYVTHGGQVGAPVGNKVCTVTEENYLGNPCIHGRWTHVRHMQGGLRGNFHARYYDTLDCACLDTNLTAVEVTIGSQTYTNLVYGPGTVTDKVCNENDHKVQGPQPRPAPANKIVFTGVGDWADPNGQRTPRATLFRVDIEDRSEPGGSHPKGSVPPPDRYRIRIWVLTPAEVAQLRGGAGDTYLLAFRNAIAACNGLNAQDGASVPNGTAAFGVRAPDVDDGSELERGNHQIHPSIKDCNP